jgi:hypothetical protein
LGGTEPDGQCLQVTAPDAGMTPPERVVLQNESIAAVIGAGGIGIKPVHRARCAGTANAPVIKRVGVTGNAGFAREAKRRLSSGGLRRKGSPLGQAA